MLSSLLGAHDSRFRATAWPRESEVFRADAAWFARLASEPIFQHPEACLELAPELRSFRVPHELSRREARRHFDEGDSIYMLALADVSPSLRQMCTELARDVGVDERSVSLHAWAAGGPTRVGMHYDLDLNFNVQILGDKRWRTAPNRHVESPMASYHVEGPRDGALSPAERRLPSTMPDDARWFSVSPGDVVYLPHGAWHCTEADGPTIAAAFAVRPPSWAEHVARLVQSRLAAEPRWRALVIGGADLELARALRADAADALNAAREVLSGASPDDLIHQAAWGVVSELFVTRADVDSVRVDEASREIRWQGAVGPESVRVPSWALPVARAIVARRAPWSVASLYGLVSAEDALFLGVLVARLEDAGLVARHEA